MRLIFQRRDDLPFGLRSEWRSIVKGVKLEVFHYGVGLERLYLFWKGFFVSSPVVWAIDGVALFWFEKSNEDTVVQDR